jgi:hypothetical protein
MNSKYLLTFKGVEGSVELTYNEDTLLVEYVLNAPLNEPQLVFLLKRLPLDSVQAEDMPNKNPVFGIVKLDQDLRFTTFWETYGQKIHPHRCEPLWDKLKDSEKLAALNTLPAYFRYLAKTGAFKVNPENYIKKQYWRTDWKTAA